MIYLRRSKGINPFFKLFLCDFIALSLMFPNVSTQIIIFLSTVRADKTISLIHFPFFNVFTFPARSQCSKILDNTFLIHFLIIMIFFFYLKVNEHHGKRTKRRQLLNR